ncbi:MAG: hypothetical protein CL590_09705 [Alteromonadaceae bacterium]|nr:hypothetical protein [Aestuariibacter sp.]MBL54144.1 hypothetical protein [Alteromonadaceae bacterium]|tara:strand:- start:3841 stop:4029 length:189 start_codon:yes stop_codon:yes gene_type:complete
MEISQSSTAQTYAQPAPVRNEQPTPPEPQRQASLESSREPAPVPESKPAPTGNVGQNVDTYA